MAIKVKVTALCEVAKNGYVCIDNDGGLYTPIHVFAINYETESGLQGLTLRGVICMGYPRIEEIENTHKYYEESGDYAQIDFNSSMVLSNVEAYINADTIRQLAKVAENTFDDFKNYKQSILKNIVESKVLTEKGLLEEIEKAESFNDLRIIKVKQH